MAELDAILGRVRPLLPLVEGWAAWSDRHRRPAAEVVGAFADAGLLRLLAPSAYGGHELSLAAFMTVVEEIARVDGSAAWTVMTANEELEIAAAALPGATLTAMLAARPATIVAGSGTPGGSARRVEGGWEVTGRWRFVTGSPTAERIVVAAIVQTDRRPRPVCTVLVPAGSVVIEDTWHVAGMRGTGSNDVVLDALVVDDDWAGVTEPGGGAVPDATFYRLPAGVRFPFPKVAVAAGLARAAIDAFGELAATKTPVGARGLLRERPAAAAALARAEVGRAAAWCHALDTAERLWAEAEAGRELGTQAYARARLAAAAAVQSCVEAVEAVAEAAGTTGNELSSPLERVIRDIRAVRQHYTVAPYRIDTAGRVLLGLDPDDPSF